MLDTDRCQSRSTTKIVKGHGLGFKFRMQAETVPDPCKSRSSPLYFSRCRVKEQNIFSQPECLVFLVSHYPVM
jgi:hypothetical protein